MANVTAMLQKPLCGNQMNLATLIFACDATWILVTVADVRWMFLARALPLQTKVFHLFIFFSENAGVASLRRLTPPAMRNFSMVVLLDLQIYKIVSPTSFKIRNSELYISFSVRDSSQFPCINQVCILINIIPIVSFLPPYTQSDDYMSPPPPLSSSLSKNVNLVDFYASTS